MLELPLCSSVTLLSDHLYRRYAQGKRLGAEITLFSVWYELRRGIVGCLTLTIALITVVFYNHPSSTTVTLAFRVVPILSKTSGRVTEAQGAPKRAVDGLATKTELQTRNPGVMTRRAIEHLETAVKARQGSVSSALAAREAVLAKIRVLLPAQKASAEAAVVQAQTELDKTVIRAGVSGRVDQLTLRPGEVVNPMLRPAGFLIPEVTENRALAAGLGQIESRVLRVGLPSEVTCVTNPFRIIPMVVSQGSR